MEKIPTAYPLSLSFICGIVLGSAIPRDINLMILSLAFVLLLGVAFLFRDEKAVLCLAISCASLIIGIFRFQTVGIDSRGLDTSIDRSFQAAVASMPEFNTQRQRIEVVAENNEIKGKVLITANRYPEYEYGDILKLTGRLKVPQNFEDFSYQTYLKEKGIYFLMSYPRIEKVGEGGNRINKVLLSLRRRFEEEADRLFGEPQSSLLIGMVVGIKREIPKSFTESLKQSGLLHIIVVSGYNMSLVIFFFHALFGIFGRVRSLILSSVGILFYALLVGFSTPVLRSAIMAWIALLGKVFGRPREALLMLLISASILLFANPLSLDSVSFQLSFAATLGLILLSSNLSKALYILPKEVAEAASTTIAASVFVLPILTYNFGSFSIISPLSNILVFLLLEPILLFGTMAILLSIAIPIIGKIVSWIAWVPLTVFVIVAETASKPGWVNLNLKRGNVHFWALYYVFLGLVVVYFQKINRGKDITRDYKIP